MALTLAGVVLERLGFYSACMEGQAKHDSLPEYQCHKVVRAARILHSEVVGNSSGNKYFLTIQLDGKTKYVDITKEWLDKHNPQNGGYFVVYEDGYTSYSPAAAFESGYTLLSPVEKELDLEPQVAKWTTEDRVAEIHRLINLVLDNQDKARGGELPGILSDWMAEVHKVLQTVSDRYDANKWVPAVGALMGPIHEKLAGIERLIWEDRKVLDIVADRSEKLHNDRVHLLAGSMPVAKAQPRPEGFWGRSLVEQLIPTQDQINLMPAGQRIDMALRLLSEHPKPVPDSPENKV